MVKSVDFTSISIVAANRLATAGKSMIFILFPYFLLQWSIPTPFFKFIIFKIILVYSLFMVYVVWENV